MFENFLMHPQAHWVIIILANFIKVLFIEGVIVLCIKTQTENSDESSDVIRGIKLKSCDIHYISISSGSIFHWWFIFPNSFEVCYLFSFNIDITISFHVAIQIRNVYIFYLGRMKRNLSAAIFENSCVMTRADAATRALAVHRYSAPPTQGTRQRTASLSAGATPWTWMPPVFHGALSPPCKTSSCWLHDVSLSSGWRRERRILPEPNLCPILYPSRGSVPSVCRWLPAPSTVAVVIVEPSTNRRRK